MEESTDSSENFADFHSVCRDGSYKDVEAWLKKDDIKPLELKDGWQALHHAMMRNSSDIPEVVHLLVQSASCDVNAVTEYEHFTPLHLVIKEGSKESVEDTALVLLQLGADRDARDESYRNAYDYAAVNGYIALANILMEEDTQKAIEELQKERKNYYGKQLIESVLRSELSSIDLCLTRGADLTLENDYGAGAIHYAITHCKLDPITMLNKLLRAGADVNMKTYEGDTALNLAIKSSSLREQPDELQQKVVTLLLEWGTDKTCKDLDHNDAYSLARKRGYTDIIELLNSVKLNIPKTPSPEPEPEPQSAPQSARIHTPTEANSKYSAPLSPITSVSIPPSPTSLPPTPSPPMTDDQSDDDDSDKEDQSPQGKFFHLVQHGELSELDTALDYPGVDLKAMDKNGDSVVHVAIMRDDDDHTDIIRFLLEHGAQVNAINKNNQTGLHITAEKDMPEVAELLLEKGIDVTLVDQTGQTAAEIADTKHHITVRDLILNYGKDKKEEPSKPAKEKKKGLCTIS